MSTLLTDGRSVRALDKRKARRKEILSAAEELFSRRGYQATSISDVIEAAGISRGTFYLYFDSRDALFHELLDGFVRKLIEAIQPIRPEDGDPMGQLYANMRRVIDLLFDNQPLTRILFREAVGVDEIVDQKLSRLYVFAQRMLTRALAIGVKWKFIRQVNEPVIATAIIGSIKEVVSHHLATQPAEPIDREVLSRELIDFGLRGLK